MRRVRSSSAQGISIVWVEFDWGEDIYRARQIVGEKLQLVAAQLPGSTSPPVLAPITSIMGEILLVGLTSDSLSPMEVRTIADWMVRKRLLAIPGVAQVVPIGGAVKQYQVLVHPDRLRFYGVGLSDVLRAAESSNAVASGGVYLESGQEILIRGLGRVHQLADIEKTVVRLVNGAPVPHRRRRRRADRRQASFRDRLRQRRACRRPSVQKQPKANTLELTDRIDEELDRLKESLPEGIAINRGIFRQADFISLAIDNVVEALRDGAVLVVVILFLFLWNFRTTAVSVLAIPLSLAVAVITMMLLGITSIR